MSSDIKKYNELLTGKNRILKDILAKTEAFYNEYDNEPNDYEQFISAYSILYSLRDTLFAQLADLQKELGALPKSGVGDNMLIDENNRLVSSIVEYDKKGGELAEKAEEALKHELKSLNNTRNINTAYHNNYAMDSGFYIDKRN